jgi:hypothetical protein
LNKGSFVYETRELALQFLLFVLVSLLKRIVDFVYKAVFFVWVSFDVYTHYLKLLGTFLVRTYVSHSSPVQYRCITRNVVLRFICFQPFHLLFIKAF